jgi:hypothetical protein
MCTRKSTAVVGPGEVSFQVCQEFTRAQKWRFLDHDAVGREQR